MRTSKPITLDFLPEGTKLLAAVKPGQTISQYLMGYLVDNVRFLAGTNSYTSFSGQFVPIIINEPLTITFRPKPSGKVKKELDKCQCSSPAIPERIFPSINSALQAISEIYEPQRASHGGKVYDYVFFYDHDDLWKPLEILRERLYLPLAPQLEPQNWNPLPANLDQNVVQDFLIQYEKSLDNFRERLRHEYKETIGNDSWQNWIRQNFWLFGANYRQPFPKEKVGFDSIPDFLFATLDGFLDFLEIKLPQHKVIVSSDSHVGAFRWSPEANEAIGQSIQYLSEIEKYQYQIAERIQQHYNVNLSTIKPRAIILIGRSDDWKPQDRTALRKLNNSLHGIEIITYSDLFERGKHMVKIFREGL
jgi:hypothetical protein